MAQRGGAAGLRRRVADMSRDELEDMFLRTHEENLELKRQARQHELETKRLQTKLTRLTGDRQRSEAGAGAATPSSPGGQQAKRIVSLQEKLADAEASVVELQRRNDSLVRKLQNARQVATDKDRRTKSSRGPRSRGTPGRADSYAASEASRPGLGSRRTSTASLGNQFKQGGSMLEETRKENQRLLRDMRGMETQMDELTRALHERERELNNLHLRLEQKDSEHRRMSTQVQETQLQTRKRSVEEDVAMLKLKREVADKSTRLQALQAKFEQAEQKLNQLRDTNEDLLEKLQKSERHLRDIGSGRVSRGADGSRDARADERLVASLRAQIDDLQAENEGLRTAHEKLLASAFDVERENRHKGHARLLNEKIEQLEAATRADAMEREELMTKLAREAKTAATVQEEKRDLHREHLTLRADYDKLLEKMKFFTRESAIDVEDIEEALAIVKERKQGKDGHLDFLLRHDDQTPSAVQKELKDLQAAHAETALELEKTRKLLKLQQSITEDYKSKADMLHEKLKMASTDQSAKLEEYARLLDARAARIQKLEAQLRDVAYGTTQTALVKESARTGALASADDALAAQIDKEIDLTRGQNVFELHISGVELTPEAVQLFGGREIYTFVTMDFFEHETQTTAVCRGRAPRFDFTAQFVVTVNEFFLHYMQHESMTVELHEPLGTDFTTLGACQLRLAGLVESHVDSTKRLVGTAKLISLQEPDTELGSIQFWMRMRQPIEQALRLHRERMKAHSYLANADKHNNIKAGQTTAAEAFGDNTNVLQVEVLRGINIAARQQGVQPAPFVAFQFYDFPDTATDTIPASNNPEFHCLREYPVPMTAGVHRFLRGAGIEFLVIDDNDPDVHAFIGRTSCPLADLAVEGGPPIQRRLELVDEHNRPNGFLDVRLAWARPYVPPPMRTEPPVAAGSAPEAAHDSSDEEAAHAAPPVARGEFEDDSADEVPEDVGELEEEEEAVEDARMKTEHKEEHERAKESPGPVRREQLAPVTAAVPAAASPAEEAYEDDFEEEEEAEEVDESIEEDDGLEGARASPARIAEDDDAVEMSSPTAPSPPTPPPASQKPPLVREEAKDKGEGEGEAEGEATAKSDDDFVVVTPTPKEKKARRRSLRRSLKKKTPAAPVKLITVEIHSLELNDKSPVVGNGSESGRQLFVSFPFLDVNPERLETLSQPIPAQPGVAIPFDFKLEFLLEEGSDTDTRVCGDNLLKALKKVAKYIKSKKTYILHFGVVSEPAEDDLNSQCETLGYASIDLAELLRADRDLEHGQLPLVDATSIANAAPLVTGTLTVSLRGVVGALHRFIKKGTA